MISVKPVLLTKFEGNDHILTVEIEMPKFIQAQFNTHRALNRNSQSSRAVPANKLKDSVPDYIPEHVGLNSRGMSPKTYLTGSELEWFQDRWKNIQKVVQLMVDEIQAEAKDKFGKTIEKGIINRPLECFKMVRVIATGVVDKAGWINFLNQRDHGDAQGPIRDVAKRIKEIIETEQVNFRDFHIPYGRGDTAYDLRYSVVRCAAVSYRNVIDYEDRDTVNRIYNKLIESDPVHWSPFEHQALYMCGCTCDSNLKGSGMLQLRKILASGRNVTEM